MGCVSKRMLNYFPGPKREAGGQQSSPGWTHGVVVAWLHQRLGCGQGSLPPPRLCPGLRSPAAVWKWDWENHRTQQATSLKKWVRTADQGEKEKRKEENRAEFLDGKAIRLCKSERLAT